MGHKGLNISPCNQIRPATKAPSRSKDASRMSPKIIEMVPGYSCNTSPVVGDKRFIIAFHSNNDG